jgi:hypothetical protein
MRCFAARRMQISTMVAARKRDDKAIRERERQCLVTHKSRLVWEKVKIDRR